MCRYTNPASISLWPNKLPKCKCSDHGQAVYEAMSLLRLLDEEVEIHEDCAPSVPRTVLKSTPELVRVYPNPGKGLFTFDIPESFEADQCLILDVTGRTIKQFSIQKNMETFQVDVTTLLSGVYLLKVYSGEKIIHVQKLVKVD